MLKPFLCLALGSFLAPSPPGPASVAIIPLNSLARHADAIFVGRVEEVFEVQQPTPVRGEPKRGWSGAFSRTTIPVARVKVERAIKGTVVGTRVHYLAMGTWTCDSTRAKVGERALFFLNDTDWARHLSDDARASFLKKTDGGNDFQLAHSGYGRMPILGGQARELVRFSAIRLPQSYPTIQGADLQPTARGRFLELPKLQDHLRALGESYLPHFRLTHHQSGTPNSDSGDFGWSLEVWGDGFARLISEAVPRWRLDFDVDLQELARLRGELGRLKPEKLQLEFECDGDRTTLRTLQVSTDDRAVQPLVDVRLGDLRKLERLSSEQRPRVASALELWGNLRDLTQQENLLDARHHDQQLLNSE